LRFAARHATRHQGERRGPAFGLRADPEDVSEPISAWLEAGRHVGIIRIALSRLDILNAARGRAVGDALIAEAHRQVRAMAAELLGDDAVVGAPRGGDIVVAAVAEQGALVGLARALDGALSRPIAVGGRQAVLGSRWSLAESAPGDDAASLLHRAAEALVSAKASDGPTIRVAGPEHTAPIDSLAIDLHFAIERDEIDILFQPQARIDSQRITGVEALARWRHGRLGPLGADVLFAAAERADLGLVLSDHIQGLVLARIAAWPETLSHVRVALNISAGDLGRPGFAYSFLRRVGASGVACDRLTVEVTESGAIHNLDRAAAILTDLRAAGLRVALDDFGTGYSSLAYLTTLPLDYLKLDKALALGIERTRRHRGVVRAVMTLARSLGLAVVAEGIETDTQRQLLAAEGCAFYQGFLLAPALDDAALAAMVGDGTC
jgi:EAL domain-containing protein (putative c-di-GMP-specific phosphodiesterase class I)